MAVIDTVVEKPKRSKTKSWRDIRRPLSAEKEAALQEQVKAEVERLNRVTGLDQLRRARSLSQVQLAEQLGTNQGALSRLERQSDLYISTLRRFVHALGGEIHIIAKFKDAEEPLELDLFGDLRESEIR